MHPKRSAEPCLHFGHCWWHSQGNCRPVGEKRRWKALGLFVSLSNDCFELLRYSSWTKFLTYCWTCWACGIASITTHNSWVASATVADWKHADFPQPHIHTQTDKHTQTYTHRHTTSLNEYAWGYLVMCVLLFVSLLAIVHWEFIWISFSLIFISFCFAFLCAHVKNLDSLSL